MIIPIATVQRFATQPAPTALAPANSVADKRLARCPECGNPLVKASGCTSCPACGWGKCG